MTKREYLQILSLEEIVKYTLLDNSWENASSPFSTKYCDNCDSIKVTLPNGKESEVCYCELNGNICKYFNREPSDEDYVEAWLNSEYEV